MNKAPTRQEIEEKAKENPVTIPERLELYRGEFLYNAFYNYNISGNMPFYIDSKSR